MGHGFADNVFSIIQLPDTDEISRYCNTQTAFTDMMQWIADNAATHNIKIVMSPGDVHGEMSGDGNGTYPNINTFTNNQFSYISSGYTILDNAGIPYLISPANHDMESDIQYPRVATSWDATYPVSRFSSQTGFFANYNNLSHTMINMQTLGGKTFMFVTFEHLPSDAVVSWVAGHIATEDPDYVIMGVQETLKPDSTLATDASVTPVQYSGQTGVNDIDDIMASIHNIYPEKAILTFGQSYLNTSNPPDYEWAGKRTEVINGYNVNFTASNFGTIDNGLTTATACNNRSFLVRYEINVSAGTIDVYTYNPNTDTSLTSNTSANYYQHQLTFQ